MRAKRVAKTPQDCRQHDRTSNLGRRARTSGSNMFGFANIDFAWLAKILSLLFLPFAHEDLAIVLGGYIVVNQIMPLGMVVAAIYVGMVVSDFALYGIDISRGSVVWQSTIVSKTLAIH